MFRFPLQRVLELREQKEQERAGELQVARTSAENARRDCGELEKVRDRGAQNLSAAQTGPATVGQLQNLSYVLQRLDVHLTEARSAAEKAEEKVSDCLSQFTAAFRDRRVIDRLKEKQFDGWKADETQADLKAMDSIALTRYARSNTSGD